MVAEALMTFDELRSKLATREAAQWELKILEQRRHSLVASEQDNVMVFEH